MSRLILLLIFALWLLSSPSTTPPPWSASLGLSIFLAGYVVLVLGIAVWARTLSRKVGAIQLNVAMGRFNRVLSGARAIVPLWLAFGLFGPVGWGEWVTLLLGPVVTLRIPHVGDSAARLIVPGLLVGTAPALLAWMGLWWAQFPAEQSLREQSLLDQLDSGLPVHAPPRFWHFFEANLRQQVLFMLLPVVLILLVRDGALLLIRASGRGIGTLEQFDDWVMLPAAGFVFVFAPEILRRVLDTRPLPPSPLRSRLEQICRRIGLRYRDILMWKTQHSMGNAAVMGLVPRLRYILLSDLLLESLTDEQIEAVFAHEAGHVVHRHMGWYVVFFTILTLGTVGPGWYLRSWVESHIGNGGVAPAVLLEAAQAGTHGVFEWGAWASRGQMIREALAGAAGLAIFVLVFGFLSRRLERQADVFAARMIETNWGMGGLSASGPQDSAASGQSHVGQRGASIFTSALRRVAAINGMPITARSWCHGSIARRIEYLEGMSSDPALTSQFDRFMSRLYASMVIALMACGAVAVAGL